MQLPSDLPKGRYVIDGEGFQRTLYGGSGEPIPKSQYKKTGGYPEIDIS